ncbi:thrombospondin [Micromonospora sp. URMC 103]|uniref:thrombospondin n=1 Tax=Micromonospora sp. URMC 103 TaxID=3423406 RepID=UPI003F1ABC47
MVRIPSLSRRSDPASTRDENPDGRGDGRDTTAAPEGDGPAPAGAVPSDGTAPVRATVADRDADRTTYRSSAAADREATSEPERRAAERAAVARAATARSAEPAARPHPDPALERTVDGATVDLDRDRAVRPDADRDRTVDTDRDRVVDTDADRAEPERPVALGPKPRASLLATLGLVVAVAGVLFVLTGTLAGYGIGLGALGAVLAVLGLMATRRRHVAGKTDALLGIGFGLAAVVLGVLAMTGQFDWPTTDGDWVQRFREWLDSQFVDRF